MSITESATLVKATEIRTIQQMWDAAVAYFEEGYDDTSAIYELYTRMSPKMTFQNIADVCSGVYADTYWAGIQMDSSILSKDLQQALGLSPAIANSIAGNALAQWRGVLSRKNISDSGSIPTRGDYAGSIDIVCNQNTPVQSASLIKNWNSSYWQTPQVGKNYIYVRCANVQFMNPIKDVTAQMFYTTGGFNQPPTSWLQCNTVGGNLDGEVTTLEGVEPLGYGIRGVSEGFSLEPTSTQHICVIAALSSAYFTKNRPLEIAPGNWNSTTYITHNGASAWHNLAPQMSVEDSLVFYNQDPTPESFEFVASCRNVPVGSKITLSVDDEAINLDAATTVVEHSSQVVRKSVTLPGNYHGRLNVRLEDPDGRMLPSSAAVEIRMHWVLAPGHERYEEAAALPSHLLALSPNNGIGLFVGAYTLLGGQGV